MVQSGGDWTLDRRVAGSLPPIGPKNTECGLVLKRGQFTSWATAKVPLSKAPNPQLLTGTGCLCSDLSTACAYNCICMYVHVLKSVYYMTCIKTHVCVYDRVETEFPPRGINKGSSYVSYQPSPCRVTPHLSDLRLLVPRNSRYLCHVPQCRD